MPRVVVLLVIAASTAHADPAPTEDLRLAFSATLTAQDDNLASDTSRRFGPGLAVDWLKLRESSAIGLHAGWSSGLDSATFPDTNNKQSSFQSLFQAHLLYELRGDHVAFGVGGGIDLLHRSVHGGGAPSFSKLDKAVGVHAQIAIDFAETRHGTYGVVASAGLFSLFQLANLCSGEVSCANQATTFSLGVTFRPH